MAAALQYQNSYHKQNDTDAGTEKLSSQEAFQSMTRNNLIDVTKKPMSKVSSTASSKAAAEFLVA